MRLPTCKEVSTAFARGEYAEASFSTRLLVRLHLMICSHCRRFKNQLELVVRALMTTVFPEPDPAAIDALQKAIVVRLKKEEGL